MYTPNMNACSSAAATITTPYAEVAPDARLAGRHTTLTYRVPDGLAGELEGGQLIWGPLRRLVSLLAREGELPLERAQRGLGSSLTSVVRALEELGLVQRVARVHHRPPPRERPAWQVRLLPDAAAPPKRAARQAEAYEW